MGKTLLDADLSLVDFLPPSLLAEAEIVAISQAIDPEIRSVAQAIMEAIIWPRIEHQPEWVLNVLAWDMQMAELAVWDEATIEAKRAMLANIFYVRKRAGTRYAVRRVFDLLSVTATIYEWWQTGAAPHTYSVTLDASSIGLTLVQQQQAYPLLSRFAPVRAQLTSLDVSLEKSGSIYIYLTAAIGVTLEVEGS